MNMAMLTFAILTAMTLSSQAAILKTNKKGFEETRRELYEKSVERLGNTKELNQARNELARDIKKSVSEVDTTALLESLKMDIAGADGTKMKLEKIALISKDILDNVDQIVANAKTKNEIDAAKQLKRAEAIIPEFIANASSMNRKSNNKSEEQAIQATQQLYSLVVDMLTFYGRDGKIDDLKSHLDVLEIANEKMKSNRAQEMTIDQAVRLAVADNFGLLKNERVTDEARLSTELEKIIGCARR